MCKSILALLANLDRVLCPVRMTVANWSAFQAGEDAAPDPQVLREVSAMANKVIVEIAGRLVDLQGKVRGMDTLELNAEQRERPHMKVKSQGGRELSISLPRGEELNEGDVVLIDDDEIGRAHV